MQQAAFACSRTVLGTLAGKDQTGQHALEEQLDVSLEFDYEGEQVLIWAVPAQIESFNSLLTQSCKAVRYVQLPINAWLGFAVAVSCFLVIRFCASDSVHVVAVATFAHTANVSVACL